MGCGGVEWLRDISEKKKEEKMRSRCYRIATVINFYIVLHSVFFIRHPVSFCFKDLDTIYAPLGVLFAFAHLYLILLSSVISFSSCKINFNRSFVL